MAVQDVVTFDTEPKVFSNWVLTRYGLLVNLNYCKDIHIEKFDGSYNIIACTADPAETDEWIIDYFEEYQDAENCLVNLLGKNATSP